MTLARVAELVRRAAADTGVVNALRDEPARLRSVLHLTTADLEALAATTSGEQRRAPHGDRATSATGDGSLLPPEGSGEATGVALSGITSTTTSVPQPPSIPPSPSIPPTPPQPPTPPAFPPPPPPPTAWPPPPPPAIQPPVIEPAPTPWQLPAYAAPAAGGGPCGCPNLAALAVLSTLSTTAITAITAIAATSRNHGVSRPEGGTHV
jgi:hypothetical protein